MKKIIAFIVTIVFTFYLAVIYNSNTVIFLAFVEIFVGSILFLWNLWSSFHLEVEIKAPFGIAERKKEIPICITIANKSVLPVGKVQIRLLEKYELTGDHRKNKIAVSVEGRKPGEKNSKTELHMMWKPKCAGKVTLVIKRGWCYDLLKIFRLPIWGKRWRTEELITILPEHYAVPVEIEVREKNGEYFGQSLQSNGRYSEEREAFQIREYRMGDPMRDIHWKLSAKENTWMVREYEPLLEDSVTFLIDLSDLDIPQAEGKNKGRKRKKKVCDQEAVLSIVLSIAESLYHVGCEHFVVWYDNQEKRIKRCHITQEEDVYSLPEKIGCLEHLTGAYDLQLEYEKTNQSRGQGRKIILDRTLQLWSDNGQKIAYSVKNLEETLTSQMLYL